MSFESVSQNMNLPIPGVSLTDGPQWASDVNNCLTLIDQHNHSPGYGVQVTPAGLNISSDLPFLSNNATTLRSTRFTSQSAVLVLGTDLNCLYVVSGDCYFNDGLGRNVRLTQGGGVSGSPGSIANLTSPASASYVSGNETFVWQSDANTPANMDAASYILRNLAASSNGLTLNPPDSMASNYGLKLPVLPAANNTFLTIGTDGTIASSVVVDNVTTALNSNTIIVKDSGISTVKIADGAVTRAKQASLGQVISSSSGSFTFSGGTPGDITNLTVTITTEVIGRGMIIMVIPDGVSTTQEISAARTGTGFIDTNFRLLRDGSVLANWPLTGYVGSTGGLSFGGSMVYFDSVPAGSHIYKLQCVSNNVLGSNAVISVTNQVLVVYET